MIEGKSIETCFAMISIWQCQHFQENHACYLSQKVRGLYNSILGSFQIFSKHNQESI